MSAWALELSEFNTRYEPRRPIKAQFLADFVNDLHEVHTPGKDWWTLYVDESSNPKGVEGDIVLEGPN